MNETRDESASGEPRPRLLIVDDEENIVSILQDLFAERPYEVVTLDSGEAAVARLEEERFDLVLTDINLGGVSGVDVLAMAKKTDPEMVVVIMTGFATTGTAIEALRFGAYDYITKPFDLWEVDNIVARGLESRRLVTENRRLLHDLTSANEELRRHEDILKEKVAVATRRIQTLYDISKDVNASLDVDRTLEFIVEQAAALTGANMGLLFRSREHTGTFVARVGHGPAAALTGKARVIVGRGVNGEVVRKLRPARLETEDPASFGEGFLEELGVRSLLAVPLLSKGHLVGVLDVMNKESGPFTEEDQELLDSFASQAAIALANAELYQHTRELESLKSDFVAVVSHEVRTPLTSIQGSLELVLDERYFQMSDKMREMLGICQTNVERLRVLIKDILEFSKIDRDRLSLDFKSVHISEVARQAVAGMESIAARKNIRLELEVAEDLPVVQADPVRIGQVFTNLIDNAIKFSSPDSRVGVSLEPALEGGLVVVVSDTGPGIAEDDLVKLFQKFQQVDSSLTRREGGLGLGLAISRGIISGHGGRIWVESEVNVGSRFHFILPVCPPAAAELDAETAEAA